MKAKTETQCFCEAGAPVPCADAVACAFEMGCFGGVASPADCILGCQNDLSSWTPFTGPVYSCAYCACEVQCTHLLPSMPLGSETCK